MYMRVCAAYSLWEGLRHYGDFVRTKLENIDMLLLQDPRSPEEQLSAKLLQQMAAPKRQPTMPLEGRAPDLAGQASSSSLLSRCTDVAESLNGSFLCCKTL